MRIPLPVRYWGKRLARRLGYEIVPLGRAPTLATILDGAWRRGARPRTIFDVGVAQGTPGLYTAFPDALYVLVEPLEEFSPFIERIAARHRVHHVPAAAGAAPGRREIVVHDGDLRGASLLSDRVSGDHVERRSVPVTTLDAIVEELAPEPPFLVKADVQGAELDVVAGGRAMLRQTDIIVLETSLYAFKHGAPQLAEVVAAMDRLGFAVYDLCGATCRPLDGALAQVDLVFARDDGPLRRSHAWSDAGD